MKQVIRVLDEFKGDVTVETHERGVMITIEVGTLKVRTVIPKRDASKFVDALIEAAGSTDGQEE